MRKKVEKIFFIITIFLLVIYYALEAYKVSNIKKNSIVTIGKIIEHYELFPENHYWVYEYFVNGVRYTSKIQCDKISSIALKKGYFIGLEIKIVFERNNPQNSSVLDCT